MKVVVIGGGPAGLYLSLLLKKANLNHDITVLERNPRNATYGWGVVFSDRTLASFQKADYKTYQEIADHLVLWEAIDVRYRDQVMRCGGNVFAGMSRRVLLNILQSRCEELDVKLKFQTEIADLAQFNEVDLLVGADGINSLVRQTYAHIFKPSLEVGKSRYIWLGTDKIFDAFTFIFRENEHGLFQVHAYPFDGQMGTFIVECEEATWQRAGLDQADEAKSIAYCETLFAEDLHGHHLMSNNSKWINFITVKNKTWRHGNMVLLGDAAHTAHFSIGSGTKLAMEDAITLANVFEQHQHVETALNDYELERRPRVEALQEAAQESRTYFEHTSRLLHLEPEQFTFHLMTRSGRLGYDDLRLRNVAFVEHIDRWFAGSARSSPSLLVAPPPLFNLLKLRDLTLANRIVLSPTSPDSAKEGLPNETHLAQLRRRAGGGAGVVMTEPVAVSPEGRITPGSAGLYCAEHAAAWRQMVDWIHQHAPAKVALQLVHAGRRGSTRPRAEGLDRPLRMGNWPLLSASPLPYSPSSPTPREMNRADMDRVCSDFVRAAQMAQEAGFDLLQLHFGHGYLLASFISPLTNQRQDEYGGSLENRLRFPLELFDAVRAVWPENKPLSVALTATDWAKGGVDLEEAVAVARLLKAHGCDLIEVLAGQTTPHANPTYGPGFLTPLSDWLRSKATIPTMVAGNLTTTDEINTILAAGRADLCIMSPLLLTD